MDTIEEFRSAYQSGGLVFFVGAGASFRSHAPSPATFKRWTSKLFLPPDEDLAAERALVLQGSSVPGSDFAGIQNELFYEHLLTLCPDLEALGLWRALSPIWLAKQGLAFGPNDNHHALARYAARTGLPVFTTNFDVLIETAAGQAGHPSRVLLPGDEQEEAAARVYLEGELDSGRVSLFKVHGTISQNGVERLDSLATTMTAITARNRRVLSVLAKVLEGRRLVLLGYSGCDIDLFPTILSMSGPPPFWFDPRAGADAITAAHIARLGAIPLHCDPTEVLGDLEALSSARPREIAFEPIFEALAAEMKVSLTPPQRHLLLAMCLNSVGYNTQAATVLANLPLAQTLKLTIRDRVLLKLTASRIADATSRYVQAEAQARSALDLIRTEASALSAHPALKARALYHLEQARQQAIGPMIRLGDPRVDWSPSPLVLFVGLIRALWIGLRLLVLTLPFRRSRRPSTVGEAMEVRAVHAANDHLVMILGRIVSVLGRFARWRPLAPLLVGAARVLKDHADRSGDFFSVAGADKYIDRLIGREAQDAVRTYRLLQDPLNFALARRDQAVEHLATARAHGGDLAGAARLFEEARLASRTCGSSATEVKALAGLAACQSDPGFRLTEIAKVAEKIEGRGYASYRAHLFSSVAPG